VVSVEVSRCGWRGTAHFSAGSARRKLRPTGDRAYVRIPGVAAG